MSSEFNASSTNLKIVKTEMKPSGEAVQLVRPLAQGNKTSEEIVDELVHKFNYKTSQVKSTENELNTVQQAFGSNLAEELIKTYEGSNLVSDSQQDLVGEKYLAEQIRLIQEQQKTTSFLDKWSHLLYEGERDYKSPSRNSGGEPSSVNVIATATLGTFTSSPQVNEQPIASHFASHSIDDQEFTSQAHISNNIINVRRSESSHHQPQIVDLQQLRLSASRNSLASQQQNHQASSSVAHQSAAQVNASSAAPISYAHSQSGIHSRTLSEVRLSQLQQPSQQVQDNNAVSTHFSAHVDSTAISSAPVGASVTAEASEYSFGADDNHSRLLIQSQQKQHQQQQEEILAYAQAQALAVKRQQDQQYQQYDDEEVVDQEEVDDQNGEACQHDDIDDHAQHQYQSSVYNHMSSASHQYQQPSHRDSASSHHVYSASHTPGVVSSSSHQQLQESSSRNSRYSNQNHHHQSSVSASVPAEGGDHQKQHLQQPHPFLPQLSSSNLNAVSLEAYNSPQFKAMLEQLSKPITIPPEHINYPPDWPSQDKINLLAEPIYIPAPQPIVIPAPNVITLKDQSLDDVFNRTDLPEDAVKPTVTYYPSIASDQAQYTNFGIRQIDTNLNN